MTDGAVPPARRVGSDDLQLEGQVRRSGGVGGEAAAGARGRERQAQAVAGGAMLDNAASEGSAVKKMVTPAAKREAVAHLQDDAGMSERRACMVDRGGSDRACVTGRSRADDGELAARARAGAAASPVRLSAAAYPAAPGGHDDQPQEDPAALPRGRPDGAAPEGPQGAPLARGHRRRCWRCRTSAGAWTSCTISCVTGRRFRVLNVVDDVTRECLAAVSDTSISGRRVVRELTI